jgi:hypothetical protein
VGPVEDFYSPKYTRRTLRALGIAVLAPALLFTVFSFASPERPKDVQAALFVFAFSILGAAVGVILVGLLVHAFLNSQRLTKYRYYALMGLVLGIAISVVITLKETNPERLKHSLSAVIFWCPLCVASALGFRYGWGDA